MVGSFTWNSIAVVGPGTALKNCIEDSLPALGLHCCVKFSLGAQSGDCSLVAGHGFLSAVTSAAAEHRL